MHFNFDKFKDDGSADENWNKAVANEASAFLYTTDWI